MTSAAPPNGPKEPVKTKQRAVEIARRTISEFKPGTEMVLVEDETQEKEFGWVFFFTTKAYQETKDPRTLVPGNGPLVVFRADGSTEYLTTSVPPDVAVKEFERRWREKKKGAAGH
jgi:hypothetical protein